MVENIGGGSLDRLAASNSGEEGKSWSAKGSYMHAKGGEGCNEYCSESFREAAAKTRKQ